MAQDMIDFVRSIYEGWSRGDFTSADWADPRIEFVFMDGPVRGSVSGPQEMARAWREMLNAWEDFRTEVEEFRQLDDERVLVLLHNSGRGKVSGMDVEQIAARTANLLHIRDGKVVKLVAWWDRDRALRELELQD